MTLISLNAALNYCGRLAAALAVLSLAACSASQAPETALQQPASIQDIMDAHVDPAADAIWASVATVGTKDGTEERQPRSDEEWLALRRHAIVLVEAGNLLVMPGRKVSHGYVASEGPGVLDSTQVQTRIEVDHAGFVRYAAGLQNAGLEVLAAIDARNAERLLQAGGKLDNACESCHQAYWYPLQKLPPGL